LRKSFHQELKEINNKVMSMAEIVQLNINQALKAVLTEDRQIYLDVVRGDDEVDAIYADIEEICYRLLAQQQPVARDLRFLVSVLRIIVEVERAGDYALNLAKVTKYNVSFGEFAKLTDTLTKMGELSSDIFKKAVLAWKNQDIGAAASLATGDDQLDEMYKDLIKELLLIEKGYSLEVAINLVLAGRYLERIADHAVNISERVVYFIAGETV